VNAPILLHKDSDSLEHYCVMPVLIKTPLDPQATKLLGWIIKLCFYNP